MKQFWN